MTNKTTQSPMASELTRFSLPLWARGVLTEDDRSKVAAAVRQVEVTTSAEIVPMVVRRSAAVGHVGPWLASLAVAVVATLMLLVAAVLDEPRATLAVLGGLGAALVPAAWWGLGRLATVQRWFTTEADLERQVWSRAVVEFYAAGLNKTDDATGILLFVSLLERQAVVLADRSVAQRLPRGTWDEIVDVLVRSVKAGALGQGFADAIAQCGIVVRPLFPFRERDRNELPDALRVKE